MEPPPLPPEALERARATFPGDHSLTDDLQPGSFFDNPTYFDSLPRAAQAPVCAVQWQGEHPDRPAMCHILSEQMFGKYKQSKSEDDLTAAFAMEALALRYVPPQHPGRGKSNHHMALLYQTKWDQSKSLDDLNAALRHYRLAFEHANETDVVKSAWINDVAFMLSYRREPGDLEEAEIGFDCAIELAGASPLKAMYLSNKGFMLVHYAQNDPVGYRQRLSRAIPCLQESISLCKDYLSRENKPQLQYARIFNNACVGLYYSWDVGGDRSHLDQAIECSRLGTEQSSQGNSWNFLFFHSQYLLDRHEITGDLEDLILATETADQALSVCVEDPAAVGSCKWIIGKVRRRWYQEDRSKQTLQAAMEQFQESVALLPQTSTSRPLALNDLGNAYTQMFLHDSKSDYIEKGIAAYEEALATMLADQDGSRHEDILMLNSALGFTMLQRYNYWKSEGDLDSGIAYYRRSLNGIDPSHRRYAPRAGNLAYALQLHFQIREDRDALRESRTLIEKALNGPIPLSGTFKNWLETHLGSVYYHQNSTVPSRSTLELAIKHYDMALAKENVALPYRATTMSNRAAALDAKADMTGAEEDYEVALTAFEQLADYMPQDDPFSWARTANQARLHYEIWKRKLGADPDMHGRRALELYDIVASENKAAPGSRINAGSAAALIAADVEHDYPRSRDLICVSLKLLPEAILLHESRLAQLEFVRKYSYVPSSATSLSIAANDNPSVVINRLEGGRATIWDRLLGLRTPIDKLRIVSDDLANRFEALQKRLSKQAPSVKLSAVTDPTSLTPTDEARLERQKDAEEYQTLLVEIRSHPELSNFLQLPTESTGLQAFAKDAPIVFVNASAYRSDALIITRNAVSTLPLPEFDMQSIKAQAFSFLMAIHNLSSATEALAACSDYRKIMKWLWYSAAKPVLEAINFSSYATGPGGKPRLVWVSTGWASILPLHAAGDFELSPDKGRPTCVHEVVVSAYTTSLKALTYIRQNALRFQLASTPPVEQQAELFTMATTPGNPPLNVRPEVASFEAHLKPCLSTHETPQPDSKAVKSALQTCTVAHFACHANADMKDPSKSALLFQDCLRDGKLRDPQPFTVRTLLNLNLKRCQLVYLSACESGANRDIGLRDEGIHLASGFHMAGVPHVISTLWRIDDAVSGRLAGLFYENLRGEETELDFGRAPDALHLALQEIRDSGVEPIFWGAFVYSGP
jgi:tetratricopeptide (TPR) repeat protein